jgi:tetratricopeptide (TPR) repeat protein
MNQKSSLLHRIGYYVTLGTICLFPVFFLPLTSEFYDFNKQILLIVSTAILLVLLTASFILDKQVRITRHPFGLPFLAMLSVWIISTFLRTPNYTDTLLEPGQAGSIISLILFFSAAINFIHSKKDLEKIVNGVIISFSLLSLLALLWGSGLLAKIIPIPFMQNTVWTPLGNSFSLIVLLGIMSPLLIVQIIREKSNSLKTLLMSGALFLAIVASGLQSYRLFSPNSPFRPVFLTQNVSWSVALEALKVSPLIGTGPSTYLSDFTRFRPISYNLTNNWAVRFSNSSNYYLELLATVGILGLLAYLFLAFRIFKTLSFFIKSRSDSPFHSLALGASISVALAFVSQIFLPTSFSALFLIFVLLLIIVASLKQLGSSLVHEANIDIVASSDTGIRTPILPWISLVLAIGLIIPSVWFFGRAYIAEYYFHQAITSAGSNNGKATYEALIQAINYNPYRDVYRVAYSQTNLLLANSISSQPNPTEETRNTVVQLIQQGIREAKNAVSLNPNKVTNVENLADTYRNLLGSAEGADSWAIAAYRQAILLDPVNPNLRISLGGILYALKTYDDAIQVFQQAVDLKSNLPNAYYNLASAFREKGNLQNAFIAMQNVVNLMDRAAADYPQAVSELEDLRKKLGETAPATAISPSAKTELEAPQPLPSPKINPPVELPAELGPETTPTQAPATP